jgi:hypothetical protein
MLILPEPKAAMGDPAYRLYGRSLCDAEACAREGEAAEMDEVPILYHTIDGAVLAHG